jgi:uncharacterized OB-fold protein
MAEKQDLVMENKIGLTYREPITPNLNRFADSLMEGRLLGQKCPSCGLVYIPGRGYCPMCVVLMGENDELEVADRGIVTGYTIVAPVRYYGQEETEEFVFASVLLDGADSPLGGQDIINIPHDKLRAGLRVKAVWKAKEARSAEGMSNRGWAGVAGAIEAFEPTGEPDAKPEDYREHMF